MTERRPGPNNAREMDKGGSVPGRTRLPAVLAPVVVLAGLYAMAGVAPYAFTFGLRPALLISELALVAPGLLALAAVRVPLPAGLGLNPHDIETIQVLKNPEDTGVYGVRGANGVIVIKTKRPGKKKG